MSLAIDSEKVETIVTIKHEMSTIRKSYTHMFCMHDKI